MANSRNDLFERAAAAAERVTEFQMDVVDKQALLKSARNRLKKAATEARALKQQVWEALGGKPRKARKSRGEAASPARTAQQAQPVPGANPGPDSNHPMCWYAGCGKPSVAAVSDWEGKTWECCADHMVVHHQTPDAEESNAESEYRRIKEQHKARPENTDER